MILTITVMVTKSLAHVRHSLKLPHTLSLTSMTQGACYPHLQLAGRLSAHQAQRSQADAQEHQLVRDRGGISPWAVQLKSMPSGMNSPLQREKTQAVLGLSGVHMPRFLILIQWQPSLVYPNANVPLSLHIQRTAAL